MEKLKNVRPGVLVIADAGLKLTPGQTVETESLTKQMEALVASGHLTRVRAKRVPPPAAEVPDVADLSKMTAPQAIASVNEMDDPQRITAQMGTEKRRSVLDALEKKRKELASGDE